MTKGTVDGMDSFKFVTLSDNQNIPGMIKFKDLELTEVLNVSKRLEWRVGEKY